MENKQTQLMTILALALVVLVLVIRFVEPPDDAPPDPIEELSEDLVDISPDQVQLLTLITKQGTLVAERTDVGWILVEPMQARGDDTALDDLVRLMDRLQVEPELTAAAPGRYGLDAPPALLLLRQHNGTEHRLAVGIDSPIGAKGYIQYQDRDVQVSTTQALTTLTRPFEIYRERRVVSVASSAVKQLSWKSAAGDWQVEQRGIHWWLSDGTRAKDAAVNGLLAQATQLRFEAFAPDVKLKEPQTSLSWSDELGERSILFGGDYLGGVLTQAPDGRVGTIGTLEDLTLTPAEITEDRLMALSPGGLLRLEIELEGQHASWTQAPDGSWLRDGAPDSGQGRAPFEIATAAAGDRSSHPQQVGKFIGWVEMDNGMEVLRVRIGQPVEGGNLAVSSQDEPPYVVPQSAMDLIRAALSGP